MAGASNPADAADREGAALQNAAGHAGLEARMTDPLDFETLFFDDDALHRAAVDIDYRLGCFCRQRQPCARYDNRFGSGPDASPWQYGAVPLWLLQTFVTHLVDLQGIHLGNGIIDPSQLPVVGFDIPTQMPGVLCALQHVHTLRGFVMAPAVEAELEFYVMTVLFEKYCGHLAPEEVVAATAAAAAA